MPFFSAYGLLFMKGPLQPTVLLRWWEGFSVPVNKSWKSQHVRQITHT